MDFTAILEEIALEGLDGITLNALWKRLENRPDFFDVNIDDECRNYLWRYISIKQDFSFFSLPEPRPELVVFKYCDYISIGSCKCILPDSIPPDIYSQKLIDQDGLKGCCDHFESRKNITEEVRSTDGVCQMSLDDVTKRWGQCFVIVASQRQRNLNLLGSSALPVGLGVEIYSILEAVGRARHDGEITQCRYERGLSNPKIAKSNQTANVFARVRLLGKLGYVIKQPFTLMYSSPAAIVQVRLVHLRRFYHATRANCRGYLQDLSTYLLNLPNHTALYTDILKDLNLKSSLLKKHSRMLQEFIVNDMANLTELVPDAKDCKTKKGVEKKVRVLRLIKPYNDGDYIEDDDEEDGDEIDDNDDNEEGHKTYAEDDGVEDTDKELLKQKPASDYGSLSYHHSFLSQCVRHIAQSGEKGLQHRELMGILNLEKGIMRCSIKELLKTKTVACIKRVIWKNNVNILVSHEVAERLKIKTTEYIKSELEEDTNEVTELQDTLPIVETNLNPSDEQGTDSDIKQIDIKVNNVTITCTMDRAKPSTSPLKKEENDKKLARKNFILKQLAQKKVFSSIRSLLLEMREMEKKLGMKELMCQKSLRRILTQLYDEGLLNYVSVHDKSKPDKLLQQMVLEPSMTLEDQRLKESLLLSSTYFVKLDSKRVTDPADKTMDSAELAETSSLEKSLSTSSTGSAPESCSMVSVCKMLDKCGKSSTKETSNIVKSKLNLYCQVAKYERVKLLHKYLFYLLYGYEGHLDTSSQEIMDENCSESPPVYLDVDDWRRHLPPLKKHNETYLAKATTEGVCMIGDLLLNMPLSLFCSVIMIPWEIDGLIDLLNDPVKKNYPITAVPQPILTKLLRRRIYLFKLNDNLQKLCNFGLVTFGTKTSSRELEFISFYLHKKAIIFDTRKSHPGYLMTSCPEGESFEKLLYNFRTMNDVDSYWNDVKFIGLSSKLGSYSVVDVKGNHGTTSILDASQPIPLKDVNEDDWLPGDHRGAGGFDSSLFLHRINSWVLTGSKGKQKSSVLVLNSESQKNQDMEIGDTELKQNHMGDVPPAKKTKVAREVLPERGFNGFNKRSLKRNMQKKKAKPVIKKKGKKITMDDADRRAKLNMRRQRAYFTPLENGMLLLSQVSSCILSPTTSLCVRSNLIRDIMQELLPESRDKTASAVIGKMTRLLKDDNFRIHLVSYVAQAMNDKNLMEKYKRRRYMIYTREMEKQFRQLHQDLRKKFSLPKNSKAVPLPASFVELMDQYEVKSTMDILYKIPKVSQDILCENDIKEMVVWELLESFLHLSKPLSGRDVYHTLSHFPDEVIHKAYTGLRTCGIFVKMKKCEKDKKQILNRSALLNNHKSTSRHKDSLKIRYPLDLFWNLKGQIEDMIKIKPMELTSSVSGRVENKKTIQESQQTENDSGNLMDTEVVELGPEPGLITADIKQGDVQLAVQHDLQGGSRGGVQDEVKQDGDEDDCYSELDIRKFQGGSVLTILSLMAMDLVTTKIMIPDEMVKLDEEGISKLYFKQPLNEQQRKRKHADIVDSDEDSLDGWPASERGVFHQQRSGKKVSNRGLKYARVDPSTTGKDDQASTPDPNPHSALAETEKCLKLENMSLTMRVLKSSASDVLDNFTVWVASGSLLTIARTSLIDRLDLLNSKCLLQRNFIVEPLDMKFALKRKAFHKQEAADNSHALKTAQTISSSAEAKMNENESLTPAAAESSSEMQTRCLGIGKSRSIACGRDSSRSWFKEESYLDLIHHLEKCFGPEMSNDDMQPLLSQIIPSDSLEKGMTLFQMIDNSGVLGITETDLESCTIDSWCLTPVTLSHRTVDEILSVH